MIRALALFAIFLLFLMIRGASLDVFWDWFVAGQYAPFFESAPDVTLLQALGLSLIVGFFTNKILLDTMDDKKPSEVVGLVIGMYVGLWSIAIFIHLLMISGTL